MFEAFMEAAKEVLEERKFKRLLDNNDDLEALVVKIHSLVGYAADESGEQKVAYDQALKETQGWLKDNGLQADIKAVERMIMAEMKEEHDMEEYPDRHEPGDATDEYDYGEDD